MITILETGALLCHLSSIYTLLDGQAGPEEATQWTGSLLQFKLATVKLAV
jgi:hypothetical protein